MWTWQVFQSSENRKELTNNYSAIKGVEIIASWVTNFQKTADKNINVP